ncbi:MAG: hypothetical protein AAF420_15985, partial [Pseudomonadota bacterium]
MNDQSLPEFSASADTNEVVVALSASGGAIVRDVAGADVLTRIKDELRPHFDSQGERFQNDFNGSGCC